MPYRVRAVPREKWPGIRRGGRFFSSSEETLLADGELTPAIRAEPHLIIVRVGDEPAPPVRAEEAAPPPSATRRRRRKRDA